MTAFLKISNFIFALLSTDNSIIWFTQIQNICQVNADDIHWVSNNHFIISSHVYFNWNELQSIGLFLILFESWYLLSTKAGPSTEQMHENRPTSVSKAESSSSQDTVTDSPDSASAGQNVGENSDFFFTTDPGLWPETLTDHEREVIVRKLVTTS